MVISVFCEVYRVAEENKEIQGEEIKRVCESKPTHTTYALYEARAIIIV
jgi:hypothetical protein